MSRLVEGAGLLLLGAGPRLAVAGVIVLALWVGFFWATGASLPWLGTQQ